MLGFTGVFNTGEHSGITHNRSQAREGVIIECPLNGQYHDARDVILTSRTDVREMVDDDDDDEWPLVIYNYIYITS